jgi:spore coat protein U-like protein
VAWIGVTAAAALWLQPAIAAPNCSFRANGTLFLAFGTLNPSVGSNAVATLTVGTLNADRVGACNPNGQTMTLTANNGLNFAAGKRNLRNGANLIPYALAGSGGGWTGTGPWTRNRPGNTTYVAVPPLTATILGTDYMDAAAGAYSDTVVLTVAP